MWIENGDEIQKSEIILLLGIVWRFQNCFFFLVLFVIEFYTFENGQRKKNNKKIKTLSRNSKKVHEQNVFYFWFHVCKPNFTKISQ